MDFKERDVPAQRMEAGGKERKTSREREGGKRQRERGWNWVTGTAVDSYWPDYGSDLSRLTKTKHMAQKQGWPLPGSHMRVQHSVSSI